MNITVYCGASLGKSDEYKRSAIELGLWIANNNHTLVYGGGSIGIMGAIADTVLSNGGKVIGVMPEFLVKREISHSSLTKLHSVDTMYERKNKMLELGDCFIALPGGIGTLEEIIEAISLARLGKNDKPCIFYNSDNYYNKLKEFIAYMVESEFLSKEDYKLISFVNSVDEIEIIINND
ncbi:TIGR00730 family Rossman fold protein [Oceanivirga salmonicida]|uniref:LOG family protein n=1 Tax=Oceanivirga salmonicida TaxID=1769291 RepID=UPI0008300157|nr:TIGR00730 family Rossman fold protein [Oceanivirga salmonicida]